MWQTDRQPASGAPLAGTRRVPAQAGAGDMGTSNMRTGGDDIAQALWLWGCEPVWEEASGRIVDFRILPVSLLGRPRVDLLLRVSGLFRDAFGDTLRLLATVPKRLAQQDEPPDMNPIRG